MMKNIARAMIIITVIALCFFAGSAWAGMNISIENRPVFFGLMHLGQEKELAQSGSYHNKVTCSSTNARSWYLKINLLQPLSKGADVIPLDSFKWQLVWTNSRGVATSSYQWRPFSLVPELVYRSGPDEASGSPIEFQFKYFLSMPEAQAGGVYNTTIRFTLTEML